MKKLILALTLASLSSSCFAGWATGRVTGYLIGNNGMFFFKLQDIGALAPCNTVQEWAVNLNAEKSAPAKAIMAAVMSAYIEGKPLKVLGTDTCDLWGDRETVAHVNTL